MMLGQGDDSAISVPAVFMFVPGMPVVVNQNMHQGLKLVNGARYEAVGGLFSTRPSGPWV